MARLLYIESSPRKARSASIRIANAFTDEYLKTHPGDSVDVLDLWNTGLLPFDGDAIDTKYAILHGETATESQKKAWKPVEILIDNFVTADKYLFSVPMWNFSIPYRLKHYIDILVQPTYTFSFKPDEGYRGLVTGRPAVLIYASGGAYSEGTGSEGYDFQKAYLRHILGFIGITDIREITVEPTLMASAEQRDEIMKAAMEKARSIAGSF
jgi:FMN-dependent NADH-azoreductase